MNSQYTADSDRMELCDPDSPGETTLSLPTSSTAADVTHGHSALTNRSLIAPQSAARTLAQYGSAFPAPAPSPASAQVQNQEIAALMQQLRDAGAYINNLERAASTRVHEVETAANEQLRAQAASIVALQSELSTLHNCVATRDADLHRANETIRATRRDLDQTARAARADVKRLRESRDAASQVLQSIKLELLCALCLHADIATRCYPCTHTVCTPCAERWWWVQEQQRGNTLADQWFKCPICRALTGAQVAHGVQVLAVKNIADLL